MKWKLNKETTSRAIQDVLTKLIVRRHFDDIMEIELKDDFVSSAWFFGKKDIRELREDIQSLHTYQQLKALCRQRDILPDFCITRDGRIILVFTKKTLAMAK